MIVGGDDMKDANGNHVCITSGCCEYTEPTHMAYGAIDNTLRTYEWFTSEGDKAARRSTWRAAFVLIALYLIAFISFA